MEQETTNPVVTDQTGKDKNKIVILIILSIIFGFLAGITTCFFVPSKTAPATEILNKTVNPTGTSDDVILENEKTNEKILTAQILDDCSLEIKTDIQTYKIPTGMAEMSGQCKPRQTGEISPSGKYLAFEDVSGGVDSVMAMFTVEYGKKVTLGVWGTSTIIDYMFLPDDRLVTVNGYPEIFNEQWISLFNTPKIFDSFESNFDSQYFYLKSTNPTLVSGMTLPDTGQTHKKLDYYLGKIQTKNSQGQVLFELSPEELVMESTKSDKNTPSPDN